MNDCFHRQVAIDGRIIKTKDNCQKQLYNERVSEAKCTTLKFYEGWLYAFKHRWGLGTFRCHGKSGSCENDADETHIPLTREKLRKYALKDTFNANEFGLNYRTAPTRL